MLEDKMEFWMWEMMHYLTLIDPKEYGSGMKKSKSDTRKIILDSAEAVVRKKGVAHLTLDAVVKESGISKGGILYHFSGKQALVQGMLERFFQSFQAEMNALIQSEEPGPGRWLRAYIRSTLNSEKNSQDLTSALIAALGTERELLTPLADEFSAWQAQGLNDGVEPEIAMMIMLAADGYWLSSIFNSQPISNELKEKVFSKLLSLTF